MTSTRARLPWKTKLRWHNVTHLSVFGSTLARQTYCGLGNHAGTTWRPFQAPCQSMSLAPLFPFSSFYRPAAPRVYNCKRSICHNGPCGTNALDAGELWRLDLYIDQQNLIFLFDPLAVVPNLSQALSLNDLRWDIRLSAYINTCVHIKGVNKVWEDLLSPWSATSVIRRLVSIAVFPCSSTPEF